MQTSPVPNQASLLPAPTSPSASRQSDSNGSITPFNQMLSREIADRRAAETPKTPESRAADNSQPAKATTDTSDAKDVKDAKVADKEKSENDKDTASGVIAATGDHGPADMLALVANLNQVSPQPAAIRDMKMPVDDAAKAGVPATQPDRKTSLPVVIGESAGDGKAKIIANADSVNTAVKPAADLAGKGRDAAASESTNLPAKPDFGAAIKHTLTNTAADAATGIPAPPQTALQAEQPAGATVAATIIQAPQQAALQAAQPAIAHLQDKLTPAVGTPAWDQALGQKVVWMVAGEHQSASLTLNPPDLGPLQVVLNVSHSTATATFSAAQPEVRQALEAALPKLREMLGDAGIQLGQASVNSGAANQQGTADRQAAQGAQRTTHADSASEAPVRIGRVQPAASGRGLVDTFV